jgi:hypothetical protein
MRPGLSRRAPAPPRVGPDLPLSKPLEGPKTWRKTRHAKEGRHRAPRHPGQDG